MRSLVVDDEPTARAMLSMLLDELGAVDEAAEAGGALACVSRALEEDQPYDLICVDLSMPGIDGLELIDHIREIEGAFGLPHHSCLLVVSASRSGQDIMAAFKNQADGYLTKPIQLPRLQKLLRSELKIPA